ncbi:MAG: EAL domain-containing protein [Proteobacteria bacterium]|nr:EAL domain-containing protein [Desulfocapsa sp.]MBU3944579.1 EAL domain-containing protein [Pseudomonadota bacterium]MCG2744636.1 EAL domain-containing protein [Desulfobacteraceae bacterium]MBU3983197.1 EAL domain-containing protein [Pseudomonadota bacterium]MBU4029635.1 EAL domain-containing protein [Pseudomonadota bacterium]
MDFLIARQPIFNSNQKLFAYELLFRGTEGHNIDQLEGDRATTSLLSATFLTEGIDRISGFKPCFINFTTKLLLKNIPASFPSSKIVIEILEDVKPSAEVVSVCRELSQQGYTIALDDFVYARTLEPLIELADIIKIDIIATPLDTIRRTLYNLSRHKKIKLLAEKVETRQEFEQALKLGFTYFQGFFFSQPEILTIKELTTAKINLLHLLAEVTAKDTSFSRLDQIISRDVAISYKLLRFLNSAWFYRLEKVKSINQAIAFLGERELKRFLMLMIISEMTTNKPQELVRLAIVRAKFCELLATASGRFGKENNLFLLGLFSLLDAMLDTPIEDLLKELPIDDLIKQALIKQSGPWMPYLNAVITHERREANECVQALEAIGVGIKDVNELYLQSVEFAKALTYP